MHGATVHCTCVCAKVYRAMIDTYIEEDAERTVLEDWEHDCAAAPTLSAEKFKDSIFELADVWTRTMVRRGRAGAGWGGMGRSAKELSTNLHGCVRMRRRWRRRWRCR